jgi:hypothetical protein
VSYFKLKLQDEYNITYIPKIRIEVKEYDDNLFNIFYNSWINF